MENRKLVVGSGIDIEQAKKRQIKYSKFVFLVTLLLLGMIVYFVSVKFDFSPYEFGFLYLATMVFETIFYMIVEHGINLYYKNYDLLKKHQGRRYE